MPEIKEYASTQEAPRPSSLGFQTQPRSDGIIMGAIGEGVSEVAKANHERLERNETSKLLTGFAEAQAKITIAQQEAFRNANPNDPDVGENFRTKIVAPMLDQLGEGLETAEGRRLHARLRANLASDVAVKTTIDQSNLAGVAEVKNYQSVFTAGTSAVKVDPTSLGFQMGLVDEWEKRVHGKLDQEKIVELGGRLRKGLEAASITGLADAGAFDVAERKLADPNALKNLDADDRETLQANVRQARATAAAADAAAKAEAKRVTEAEANEIEKDISSSIIQPDGSLHITPEFFTRLNQELARHPGANGATVRAMNAFGVAEMEREAKGIEIKTDPDIYENFRNRIFKKGDPNALTMPEVYRARTSGLLSKDDFALFKSAIEEVETKPETAEATRNFNKLMDGYKGYITNTNPYLQKPTDPVTNQMFYDFSRDARPIFDRMSADGKSLRDIEAEIARSVPRYTLSKDRAMQLLSDFITKGIVPQPIPNDPSNRALPGESPADWVKRTRGGQ